MSVKVSLNNWMRPEPLSTTIERVARLGYDGVELLLNPLDPIEPGHARELLDRHAVDCVAVAALMVAERDLLNPDRYARMGAVAYLKDAVRLAGALGATTVTVAPASEGRLAPRAEVGDEWGFCVDSLRECRDFAVPKGIRIGIEPVCRFETYFVNQASQALALADAVGEGCGVVLDTFHMNLEEEDPHAAIRATGERLVNFHIADSTRLPPGRGTIDWARIFAALRGIGYNGPLSVEFVPRSSGTSERIGSDGVSEAAFDNYAREAVEFVRAGWETHAAGRQDDT